tara:strand:+ start:60 stop:518 length:459 start_codon:yes stop_codon:yes gene_type:complete
MPKLTELTATTSLANADLFVVSTNTAGTKVSNSVSVDTISAAVSVGGSAFPGHVKFTVSANGSTAFNFAGGGAQGSDNETLHLYKGFTYLFDANSIYGTMPIRLNHTDGTAYSNGVSESDGRITFTVPQNAANLIYRCTNHAAMNGSIVIVT